MPKVKLIQDAKPKTVGQYLARMLRTAVVECQAVEAGRHPKYRLDMSVFEATRPVVERWGVLETAWGNPDAEQSKCGCLGGIYTMLSRLRGAYARAGRDQELDECFLNFMRLGLLPDSSEYEGELRGLKPLPPRVVHAFEELVKVDLAYREGPREVSGRRARWDTYLKACTLLESYS